MNSANGHNADVQENPKTEGASDCSVPRSTSVAVGQEGTNNSSSESSMPAKALEPDSKPFEEVSGPTENSISDTGEIESPRLKARLRSCANPLYPALIEIARAKKKDLELLSTILWSINAPPSLRALPRIARNLRRSVLILQTRYQINLAAAGLGEWPEMLKWLASDLDVKDLCYGKKGQFTSVLYHCATTHSFYALLWELIGKGLARVRACLALLYIVQAAKRVDRGDYESHLREGTEVVLCGHSPYEAWRAVHSLRASENAQLLFSRVAETSSLAELQVEVSSIDAKLNEGAVLLHLPTLKAYLTRLTKDVPTDRMTAITSKQRSSSGTQHRSGRGAQSKSKTDVHTVDTAHGRVGMRRQTPPTDERTRARLRKADATPDEVTKGETVWIATPPETNVDPAVHAATFRMAARAMHKPVELMQGHQRHLSTDELTLLLRQSREAALEFAASHGKSPESQRKLIMLATSLCSLFTWTDFSDAADTWIFGPATANAHVERAIFLGEKSTDDYIRIAALVPDYTTPGRFDPSKFRDTADYVILSLPPILGLVMRTLFANDLQRNFKDPVRLVRNAAGMDLAIGRFLRGIDATGRLTLSRIRESFFSRVVSATCGDMALFSLIFARKHYSVDAELYYLAYGTREIASIHLAVVQKIHAVAFPDWIPPAVDIDKLVPDADLGCRYYPDLEELTHHITEVRERAVKAWRLLQKRKKFDPLDAEFAKLHNDLTLYVCLRFAYSTGARAITSPLPSFDAIIVLTLADGHCVGIMDWSDKDDRAHYHKCELFLDQDELKDLEEYSQFIQRVRKSVPGPKTTKTATCFYIVNGKRKLVSPASTAKIFGKVYPYPPNTHRRILSRELRSAGKAPSPSCEPRIDGMSPEIIRAGILHHWSADREPWSALSGLSLPMIRDAILRHVPPIVKRLGFAETLEKAVLHE